jgi:hypothetical protein
MVLMMMDNDGTETTLDEKGRGSCAEKSVGQVVEAPCFKGAIVLDARSCVVCSVSVNMSALLRNSTFMATMLVML